MSGPAPQSLSTRLPWGVSSSSSVVSHDTRHAAARAAAASPAAAGGGRSRARGLALRMVAAPEMPTTKVPGSAAGMDWENLGFEYRDGEI